MDKEEIEKLELTGEEVKNIVENRKKKLKLNLLDNLKFFKHEIRENGLSSASCILTEIERDLNELKSLGVVGI